MGNKQSSKEWLVKAYHDLKSAQILYEADHYTDSIGVDLHYCIEKSLKSFLAYENKRIVKTHDLPELYELVSDFIEIEDEMVLYIATKYHVEISYPQYDRALPTKDEIKKVLDFTNALFYKVCKILDIDPDDLKSVR